MLTGDGPRVIEFNARFGDPETQALLPLLRSSLLEPLRAIASGGGIAGLELDWRDDAALTVVLAAAGYPGSVLKGDTIDIPVDGTNADDVFVFHAGTKRDDEGRLVTDGGRILAVTAVAPTLAGDRGDSMRGLLNGSRAGTCLARVRGQALACAWACAWAGACDPL